MTYRRGVESFDLFRQCLGVTCAWPAPIPHVIAFLSHLSIEGKAPSTIGTYLASIAFVHKVNGWIDPTDNFVVKKMREGSRRLKGQPDCRSPITISILNHVCQSLNGFCTSVFEVSLFKAAFLLAFFGFLRVGEFTAISKNSDSSRILNIKDVSINKGGFMNVVIRFSKTDQRGKSVTLRFQHGSSGILCPVKAMTDYLCVRPMGDGPLFIHSNSSPLTRYQFDSVLKKGIRSIGLEPKNFSPHSFRIGAATAAAVGGIPLDSIKSMGRWQSSAVMLYIRPHRIIHSCALSGVL